MAKITVYPVKQSSLVLLHPGDGRLVSSGSQWENDGFTARMISDNLVTTDQSHAYTGEPPDVPSKAFQAKPQPTAAQPAPRGSRSPYTAHSKR